MGKFERWVAVIAYQKYLWTGVLNVDECEVGQERPGRAW